MGAQSLEHLFIFSDDHGTKRILVDKKGEPAYIEQQVEAGVSRLYTLDILRLWLDGKKISRFLYDSGRRYEHTYRLSAMGPNYATGSLERVDRSTSSRDFSHTERARKTINTWNRQLGPCCEPIEMVLGHSLSFKDLAWRIRAQGIRRASERTVSKDFLKSLIFLDQILRET